MKTKIFLFLSLFVISFSCYKEDAVEPTEGKEEYVNFGLLKHQGTNIYQQRLLDYFDKYKVLTLYRFTPSLFHYEITSTPPYNYTEAKEANVGALLDLIDEVFYKQIGDKAILEYMPLNILLVSELRESNSMALNVDCYFGLFCLTFAGANEAIESWDNERKQIFKNNIVYSFLQRMYDRGFTDKMFEFQLVSNYMNPSVNESNYKELGFLRFDKRYSISKAEDLSDYIRMAISTSTEELNAKGGLLDPEVDKKGLIKRKYNIIVNFYKEYGVDMVKIANYKIN